MIAIILEKVQLQTSLEQICRTEQLSLVTVCVRVSNSLPVHSTKEKNRFRWKCEPAFHVTRFVPTWHTCMKYFGSTVIFCDNTICPQSDGSDIVLCNRSVLRSIWVGYWDAPKKHRQLWKYACHLSDSSSGHIFLCQYFFNP